MSSGRPATISNDLLDQLGVWLDAASLYLEPDSFQFKLFMRSVDKLSVANPVQGSIAKAILLHITGDREQAYYWLDNARTLGAGTLAEAYVVVSTNLGYFSEAAEILDGEELPMTLQFGSMSLLCGCFQSASKRLALESDDRAGSTRQSDTDLATRCSVSLNHIGVNEAHVQAMLDIVGSVLRSHKMFFADRRPLIRPIHDGILYQMHVPVNATVSDQMTDEVLTRMVEQDLDAPGLAFSFIPAD